MDAIKQYRNEWKYCCSESTLALIDERLSTILNKDAHSKADGRYEIHSLYFDDFKNSCARENESGTSKRFKYRIRYYGTDTDFLKLERKDKLYGRCHKESCRLSRAQYDKLIAGCADEVFWETDNTLLKTFCLHCMNRGFSPRAIIDYERIAYVEEIANVRITLDENISVSGDLQTFLDGGYLKIPIQKKHQHVLEVKFDNILPGYIRHIITSRDLLQTSFSKYYVGRRQLQRMEG